MMLYDRIHGCLLGGACGDALGAPVEFLTLDDIREKYGPEGIVEFDDAYGMPGLITDDTQMTLFTVEGLIRADVRFTAKGICHPPSVVHHAYRRWLITQEESPGLLDTDEDVDGWLVRDKRLWARRSPGLTCLSALRSNRALGRAAENNSKGCGTVMRDAPFGFIGIGDLVRAFDLALETARTTHGHPSASFSSAALAAIIAVVAQGSSLRTAVEQALSLLHGRSHADEVQSSLQHALRLSAETDWRVHLPELGEGWVAEEALAISILCALATKNPRDAVIAAVNRNGDSDSTGAITGNIVGTLYGAASFPNEWVEQVELRDVIETLAHDLTSVVEGQFDPELHWERYPGW